VVPPIPFQRFSFCPVGLPGNSRSSTPSSSLTRFLVFFCHIFTFLSNSCSDTMGTTMNSVASGGDAELVSASLEGDREAYGRIVTRYQSLVCSLAYSATGSLTQSEDLAQETFLEAWKNLASLREPQKLRSWLCGIARNRIYQAFRLERREPSHQAEPLENLAQAPCPEPLPPERAISREEGELLWRTLEQLPETYRLPLVLFYREHQSVEMVARNLDLSEAAARQRLSRARKLLQEEVQAFVETALSRTSPGKAFTLGVIAALPLTATSAKAASGVVVAKGAAGAKGVFLLPLVSGLAAMLGSVALSWKFAADEAQSPDERKFLRRVGRGQVLLLLVLLVLVAVPTGLSLSGGKGLAWLPVALFALVILAVFINSIFLLPWMVSRQVQLRMDEGGWPPAPTDVQQGTEHTVALRKACKQSLPSLVMLAGCIFFLPWKKNWLGSAAYVGVFTMPALWYARRLYWQFRGQHRPSSLWKKMFAKHPMLAGAAGVFLCFLICIVLSNLGVRYLAWLNTGTFPDLPLVPTPMGHLLLGLLVAVVVFAMVAVAARRLPLALIGLAGKLRMPFLEQILAIAQGPSALLENTYKPLFEQLKLEPARRRQLKDLLLKRATLGSRAGMPLMNPRLAPEKRASLLRELQADKDACTARIREILGDGFPTFQEFEQGIKDRMLLDQFTRKTNHTTQALNEAQRTRLLEARLLARRSFPWTNDLARQHQDARLSEVFTLSSVASYIREQSEFDRQFLEQVRQVLSPEQLALFQKLQTQQRESQTNLFRMGIKLFGNPASC
jgi:RNA polymerase sigma factor (sigma-70 family)